MKTQVFFIFLALFATCVAIPKNRQILSSLFSFGKSKTTTTMRPTSYYETSDRCSSQTKQCSAYECCNSNQSCIRNRCFPRLSNCPVTRDQCGNSCCRTSEICKNGRCT